ncbi:MAG: MBOAT family protein [Phycisphaerae bacterium]|nr:MBOAT family protein [Phycisphaerae bacterium]
MTMAVLASLADILRSCGQYLAEPVLRTPWTDWRGFWLEKILDDRFVVVYFLPLVPLLLLLPRQRLRLGIVLTGLVFAVYLFGALYAALWLLTCIAFYWLAERFAIECRRTDVLPIGPPLAAITIVGGWYIVTMVLHKLSLPTPLNDWLFAHARWIFPLGTRGLPWEPFLLRLHESTASGQPAQLVYAMFWNAHNIGTAYLAARLLHYFSDLRHERIPAARRTLLNFLAYVCYAPTWIQGPIERYGVFQDELDTCHARRTWRNVPPALTRIGWGVLKSLIVTWYFHPLFWHVYGLGHVNTYYQHPEQIASFALLYFGVFLQIFGLYLEFSGYCDVSAGVARLLGYRQIENFNWPWFATSMRDFWRRWHISLSALLRDYLYIPFGGNRRHTTLNLCLTFFIIGLWHKLVPQVGIWGIVMGLMVAASQHWARWTKRLEAEPARPLARLRRGWLKLQPLPWLTDWLITQHLFVFSLLIFFGGAGALNVVREILRRVWQWLV